MLLLLSPCRRPDREGLLPGELIQMLMGMVVAAFASFTLVYVCLGCLVLLW